MKTGEVYLLGEKTGEYIPPCDRKSWYGKCRVDVYEGGEVLISYNTAVMFKDREGRFINLWGWSATTGRHERMWSGLGKKQVEALPSGSKDGGRIIID